MIVVDASVMIEVLLVTPAALAIEAKLFDPSQTLHSPHLLDLEVAQVLRRYCASGEMTDERAQEALADLASLSVNRYPHEPFLRRVWELRHNVTAYDAAYVALAEALDAPLWTRDQGLASAPGPRAVIELL